MRKLLLPALALTCFMAWAGPIDVTQAESIARQFVGNNPRLNVTTKLTHVQRTPQSGQQTTPIYVFNNEGNNGFVIVSGDDNAQPILGYSTKGAFSYDDMRDNLRLWMQMNERYVAACSNRAPVSRRSTSIGTPVVAPLLGDISWGQSTPFNNLCPTYTHDGQTTHYYVGCVATAATQIMRYHKYPAQGIGSKSLVVDGQTITADYGNTTYDWDNMLPSYDNVSYTHEQGNAVATLAMQFGVAVDMEYMPAGSGAHSMVVPAAYRDYFGYDSGVVMRKRDYYSSDEWLELIKSELEAGRPVYYAAASEVGSSGHAFVCDGYDSEGYVHINWGWYGRSDGYFLVNHLDPDDLGIGGGTGGYNIDQEIVTGIQRPTGEDTPYARPMYNALSMKLLTQDSNNFGVMMSVENFDTKPFAGQIGAALVRDGQILQVLNYKNYSIAGFANNHTGMLIMQTMYDITRTVDGTIADGQAQVWLVFREDAQSAWQIMRYCRGRDSRGNPYVGYFPVTVSGGRITDISEGGELPDATILNELKPQGEVYEKGSALFVVDIRNNSPVVRLRNIVLKFQDVDDETKVFEYENQVNVYDRSQETVQLLVNLSEDMPTGTYYVTAYEKGFADNPFELTHPVAQVEVLPQPEVPVMRLTQSVQWRRSDGTNEARQGDNIYFALNTRNYASAGNVGVILNLVNTDDETKAYVYQQSNTTVGQGESKTLTFYRKLPVDPGTYKVVITYATDDGKITTDPNNELYPVTITVGEAEDIYLNAVNISLPDYVVKGEKLEGSVTLSAPDNHNGYVYVRMRQYTLTNGGILYMGNQNIPAGTEKTINISSRINFEPGRYLIMVEARRGNVEGTVGNYANCYKLIEVVEELPKVRGDVNGDGSVDISDVNTIINVMLGTDTTPQHVQNADITGDGDVDVSDVNDIINIMLN